MSISNLIPSMRNSFVIREREDYKSTKHFNTKNVTNTIQYIFKTKTVNGHNFELHAWEF